MITLHESRLSGNAWKVRLLLDHLGIAYARNTLDLAKGGHREPGFAARNRFRRVPVVELADGTCLAESNAILIHFAEGTPLLPPYPRARTAVLAWLFYDQADLSRFLAYPRFYAMTGQTETQAAVIEHYRAIGRAALAPVEETLAAGPWLAGPSPTIADFALYPYIRLAPEGGYDLSPWAAVGAWLARFEALPGYSPLVPDQQP